MKRPDIEGIFDRTQGHLILRWNARRSAANVTRMGLSSIYCFVGLFFLIVFIIESFLKNYIAYSFILTAFALLTVLSYIYLRITGNSTRTNNYLVLLLALLCLFLLYTGGIGGTGPMWYFVFPLFALFVQRLWAGILSVFALFIITALLLWHPVAGFDPGIYSQEFIERFLAVYMAVSIMAFMYAFLRTSNEMDLDAININLKDLANTDELTKLANRRRMEEVLYQEVSRTRRLHGTFSLILLDLDNFKNLNDEYGHDCGDAMLRSTPEIFHHVLRTQDICSRWGGKKFLILLPATNLDGAAHVAERLRMEFENYRLNFGNLELTVTASMGVSEFNLDKDLEDCLQLADNNLYLARAFGRNCVVAKQ